MSFPGARLSARVFKPEWLLIAYLWVCYVLNHADRQVVYTLFPILQKEFHYSDTTVGLTGALFLWVYAISSPFSGVFGDKYSRAKIVVASLAVWSTFTVLSGLAPNGASLLACRALLGVSESLFMPAAYALMAAAHGPQTRSRAIAIFGTSQLFGVAGGGSLSGYVADHLNWRASFLILGAAGLLFAWPLWRFLHRLPPAADHHLAPPVGTSQSFFSGFRNLLRVPSLRIATLFVAVATFGLFLTYTWLPTFLFDKFHMSLSRSGFEASTYPQIGSMVGLLAGSVIADRLYARTRAARFWVITVALLGAAPCLVLLGSSNTITATRMAAIGFGFFSGFISGNQAAAAFDVVPAHLRASTVGVLNLLGSSVSGFGPFLGGLARKTVGVDRLISYTGALYVCTALLVAIGTRRHFARDYARAQER